MHSHTQKANLSVYYGKKQTYRRKIIFIIIARFFSSLKINKKKREMIVEINNKNVLVGKVYKAEKSDTRMLECICYTSLG